MAERKRDQEAPTDQESRYTADELVQGASGFGTSRHAMAGALVLAKARTDRRYTRAEAEDMLKAWASHEVED